MSIYNRALSSTEIQNIYDAGSAGKCGSSGTSPSITQQPASTAVYNNAQASFTVGATGATPMTWQWYFNGAPISGASQSAYTIASATASNIGSYSVVINNSYGHATSVSATLNILPTISQPQSVYVFNGTEASFQVTAVGSPTLTYQWSFNGTAISGATQSAYIIPSATLANAGSYTVQVANPYGQTASSPATLNIMPTITQQPQSQTVSYDAPATFTVAVIGSPTLTYQWNFNGSPISGAVQSAYTISQATLANAGTYTVTVSNPYDRVTSAAATLAISPGIISGPVSQTVMDYDAVTFDVTAAGEGALTYQWAFNGTPITGATSNRYTLLNMQPVFAGTYTVTVSNPFGTATTNAYLSESQIVPNDPNAIYLTSNRQDYTFRSDSTYIIESAISLYGTTTIEGGTTIKLMNNYGVTNSSLIILGTLNCDTGPYRPAILSSTDDDSVGLPSSAGDDEGSPRTGAANTSPYLNLDGAQDIGGTTVRYLHFAYASQGVTTPLASENLQLWDCQFVNCAAGPISRLKQGGSTIGLHNVLFANHANGEAIGPVDANAQINAEQVTVDVGQFCDSAAPHAVRLTNSIIVGSFNFSGAQNVDAAINPSAPFQSVGDGNYYLAGNSPFRQAGANNISAAMQSDLANKTTYPPIAFGTNFVVSSSLTLFPQTPRYASGATPDYGYYYDAMDYTIAEMINAGSLTILPGTAIGFRNDFLTGELLTNNSTLTAHGTPTRPINFTDPQFVQEGPYAPGPEFTINPILGFWPYGGTAAIQTVGKGP